MKEYGKSQSNIAWEPPTFHEESVGPVSLWTRDERVIIQRKEGHRQYWAPSGSMLANSKGWLNASTFHFHTSVANAPTHLTLSHKNMRNRVFPAAGQFPKGGFAKHSEKRFQTTILDVRCCEIMVFVSRPSIMLLRVEVLERWRHSLTKSLRTRYSIDLTGNRNIKYAAIIVAVHVFREPYNPYYILPRLAQSPEAAVKATIHDRTFPYPGKSHRNRFGIFKNTGLYMHCRRNSHASPFPKFTKSAGERGTHSLLQRGIVFGYVVASRKANSNYIFWWSVCQEDWIPSGHSGLSSPREWFRGKRIWNRNL